MLKTKIKISIITPFFKGNPYMPAFRSMILRNAETIQESELADSLTFEVVMVNDSPGEEVMFWEVQKENQDPSISGTVEDAGGSSVSDSEKDSLTSSNYEIGKIFQFNILTQTCFFIHLMTGKNSCFYKQLFKKIYYKECYIYVAGI